MLVDVQQHLQPRASATAVNRPNENSCAGITCSNPSNTSVSLVHGTDVLAFEPCITVGLPWSTTADRVLPGPPRPTARDIRSKMDS